MPKKKGVDRKRNRINVKPIEAKLSKEDESKLFAFLAVFLLIIGFIIALMFKRNDKYVMYYAKQSLVLFIVSFIIWAASLVLKIIPLLGWFIAVLAWILWFICWLITFIDALSGEMKPAPLFGSYAEKIKL